VILNRFLAADLVFILGILLPFSMRLADRGYSLRADQDRKAQSPKSIANRHGMPCRTVPERRAYSGVLRKAQRQ
jgi:hypothetical protein